jgi:hypothetical protein
MNFIMPWYLWLLCSAGALHLVKGCVTIFKWCIEGVVYDELRETKTRLFIIEKKLKIRR